MGWPDHVLGVFLVLILPLYGLGAARRLRRAVARGELAARSRIWLLTAAVQWGLVAAVLLRWRLAGRPISTLGVLPPPEGCPAWILGLEILLLAAVAAGLLGQWAAALRSADTRRRLRGELEPLTQVLPRRDQELPAALALAVTAGICEEVLFRGFLLAWLAAWVSPWLALLPAALAFGAGHFYQGARGAGQAVALGLGLGVLYLASGVLWVPIAMHILMDVHGMLLARALDPREAADEPWEV